MTAEYRVLDNVQVRMRDGTMLSADVWLPGVTGSWPVLLQRTPYRRETPFGSQHIAALEFQSALRRGYAVVVQDTRGRFGSGGDFEPFAHETDDGVDTIAWLTKQSFCDGRVTMFGASYVGATQILAAVSSPPGLRAIAPQLTTARHGATWMYRGGALELGFILLWLIEGLGPEDVGRKRDGRLPDAGERARKLFVELQANPVAAFGRAPVLDQGLEELAPYLQKWLSAERLLSAEGDRERLDDLVRSECAMLVIGGFNDIFVEGAVELFTARRTSSANDLDRLIIGPWSHGNPSDWQGDEWLGYGASAAELSGEQLGFFDAILAGSEPGTPRVRYFRSGSNSWHAEDAWPPTDALPQKHRLGADGSLGLPVEDGTISFVANPREPVPTIGGASFLPGLLLGRNSGPKDQTVIEARDDVLLFTSEPMQHDIEVSGAITADLWVASTTISCDWTIKVCDVNADGRSLSRVDGIRRWNRSAAADGHPEHVTVDVGSVSHLFKKGHRIRIQLAASNFPRFDRNPQTGQSSIDASLTDFITATHTVFCTEKWPSSIILPIKQFVGSGASSIALASEAPFSQ